MRSPYAQVTAIVVIGLCVSPARSQLLASQARGPARAQVVMLSVKGGCAAGIIVGYDEKVVYIATAAHIADLSAPPFPPVTVKFEGLSKSPGAGKFWPRFEPKGKGDLAVVTVDRDPSLNRFLDELDFALLSPVPLGPKDTPVASIGCNGGAEWSTGNAETLLTPAQGYLRFQSEVGEGQSGGGLYNEAWELIGMPLDVGDNGVYARPIDEILEDLRKWGVPTRLAARPLKDRVRGADEIAREKAAMALSRYLLAEADSLKDGDYNQVRVSALLRIEAGRRSSLLESGTALRESSTVLPVLQVLQDETTAMGFSADGKLFLSAGGKSLQISSMETLTALWRKDLKDTILAAALSPDGRLAAAGDNTGTLSAFDARSGRPVWTLQDFGKVTALSFSPDSRYVGGTAHGGGAVLLEAASGQVVQTFESTYTFYKVAFSPDAKRFAAFGGSGACEVDRTCAGKVLLFNLENRSRRLLQQPRPVLDLRFTPRAGRLIITNAEGMRFYTLDGEALADDKNRKTWDDYALREANIDPRGFYVATEAAGTITLWFVPGPDGFVPNPVQYPTEMTVVNTFAFSGPAHYLAVGAFGLTAVYETGLETGRNKQVFRFRSPGNSLRLLFTQDDSFLATGGETGVQVFALRPGRVRSMILPPPNTSVSFVCGGRYLAYEFREGEEFQLLDPGTGVQKAAFHPGKFNLAEASCDGNYIAVRTKDDYHKGRLLNRDGQEVLSLDLPSINGISCLGITGDSRTLTIAGSSRGAQYDLATGRLLGSFELKESVDFSYVSPSGHFLVGSGYVGSNGTYFLYRLADKTFRDLGISAHRIAFTPDDRLYATTEGKGPIRVYEAASGRLLFEVPYEREESTSLTFSADGRLLASTGGKHIRVFDVSSGQPVALIEAGADVFSISFSEDLTRLYTVELRDRPEADAMLGAVSPFKWEVVEHLLSTSLLIDDNCRRLTRNLTCEEWKLYLPDACGKTCPLLGQ